MRALSNLWERLFGPRSVLAEPGFDPTVDPLPDHLFGRGRGSSGGLPWLQILLYGGAAVVFFFGFLKPKIWPAKSPAEMTATSTQTATATQTPTPGPTTTPSRTPIPSRTPYGTPFGQKPAGAPSTASPVVNFTALTERAVQTLIAAASASPVVIIEHTGGAGCGDCGSSTDPEPLPTYTPYPTLEPLEPLPTYTPVPTYTPFPTAVPTCAPTATPTTATVWPGPDRAYTLYLPLVPGPELVAPGDIAVCP